MPINGLGKSLISPQDYKILTAQDYHCENRKGPPPIVLLHFSLPFWERPGPTPGRVESVLTTRCFRGKLRYGRGCPRSGTCTPMP